MAALVHIAAGLAAKPIEKRVPVVVAIVAAEVLDLLAVGFGLLGIEGTGNLPWSHGLVMSLVISAVVAGAAILITKSNRIGLFLGILVFSHWIIDFITHPMGAVFGGRPSLPDMPIAFGGSPKIGLGLYNNSLVVAYIVEFASTAIGIAIYVIYTVRNGRRRSAA